MAEKQLVSVVNWLAGASLRPAPILQASEESMMLCNRVHNHRKSLRSPQERMFLLLLHIPSYNIPHKLSGRLPIADCPTLRCELQQYLFTLIKIRIERSHALLYSPPPSACHHHAGERPVRCANPIAPDTFHPP